MMVRLHAQDGSLDKKALVSQVRATTGLRHVVLGRLHDNLVHCNANGIAWEPSKRYNRTGLKNGPASRLERSPGAAKRARTALREAGSARDAVGVLNDLAEEEGRPSIVIDRRTKTQV
eukprot:SAG11_NODE_313_length_10878_cov_43.354578_2_plen_118_part_00